jgi:menaquinol-cytochrome c reductase iron-sulfur subunit
MSRLNKIDRRKFMGFATWAVGGLISAAMAIPAVNYIIGTSLKKSEDQDWIRLGSSSKIELGTPTLFKTTIQKQTGWIINETELSIYILTDDGREFVAMSNICTHLGCRVRWIGDEQQFFCPCHNAIFAKDGSVVTGPPPRPLDRYEIKVEEDQIYVLGG